MARVQTGLEVLAGEKFAPLRGLRVGLVTNQTGILPDTRSTIRSTIEVLYHAPDVHLTALFGPEHGVRGDAPAGKYVASGRDAKTSLPVYSLYGRTRVPTAEMLRGLDALVFDIQDIGSRSYTFLSTLGAVMEGASLHRIPVIVLDRPNPLGGVAVEGNPVERGFASFVGKYPVAYRHGMTLGELAKMINGQGWLPGGRQCDLTVVSCKGLTRAMAGWESFGGLPWVPTSPHVPYPRTPAYYAATGITGELPTLSIGIGHTLPFEMAGAPGVSSALFTKFLEKQNLQGMRFQPATWVPNHGVATGQKCTGTHIVIDDIARADLTRLNWEILVALREAHRLPFAKSDAESTRMFDLSCGTDRIRRAFLSGATAREINDLWNDKRDGFLRARKSYLLYT